MGGSNSKSEQVPTDHALEMQSPADATVKDTSTEADKKGKEKDPLATPNTQLLYAASVDNRDLIRSSIDAGASVNYIDNGPIIPPGKTAEDLGIKDVIVTGDTAMHKAAEAGHTESVKLLFFLQADIEIKNKVGSTPLHRACSTGKTAVVEFLLSKGARIDAMNNAGNTPLHCACYIGHMPIIKLLLAQGAWRYVDRTNRAGMTPVDYARKPDLKDVLIMAKAHRGMNTHEHDEKKSEPSIVAASSTQPISPSTVILQVSPTIDEHEERKEQPARRESESVIALTIHEDHSDKLPPHRGSVDESEPMLTVQ